MKTALIPSIRVEPQLREELESVLQEGESLSSFVEASVRRAVEYRRVQEAFQARGEQSWQAYLASGQASDAADVVERLQAKVDARRKALAGR